MSRLFENCRLKVLINILPVMGDKNDQVEDESNNENIYNVSTNAKYLNNQPINLSQISLENFNHGVDIDEVYIHWRKL